MDYETLFAAARMFGFVDFGVCSIRGFEDQQKQVLSQPKLKERQQLRFSPQEDCPWATALLVLLWSYAPAPPPSDDGVFIDSYYFASNQAYHAAKAFGAWLEENGHKAEPNVSYPARTAAVRSGLGIVGHNGMLIHPEFGSRVVIILLATDAIKGIDVKETPSSCNLCGKCIKACPMGAIDEHGMSHPERCLRNFMMEGTVVPEYARRKMAMKLVGCDACQRVCPMQPKQEPARMDTFDLDRFMTLDDTQFREAVECLGKQIGRNAARPQRVRAQVALLAGNRGNASDIPVLEAWAASSFEAVREHASWALSQFEENEQGLDQTEEKR